MKYAKKLGIALAALLALIVALPYLISAEKFRPAIENRLQAALGRRVDGKLLVYLDSAATAQDLERVLAAVNGQKMARIKIVMSTIVQP